MHVEKFRVKSEGLCSNQDELCNIVLDLCYTNNESKQFAWDICGDTIIENLLINNDYMIEVPELSNDGEIEFGGLKFNMKKSQINKEELDEYNIND